MFKVYKLLNFDICIHITTIKILNTSTILQGFIS